MSTPVFENYCNHNHRDMGTTLDIKEQEYMKLVMLQCLCKFHTYEYIAINGDCLICNKPRMHLSRFIQTQKSFTFLDFDSGTFFGGVKFNSDNFLRNVAIGYVGASIPDLVLELVSKRKERKYFNQVLGLIAEDGTKDEVPFEHDVRIKRRTIFISS